MKKMLLAAALVAGLQWSYPSPAQETAYTPGTYLDVQGVYVEDGQFDNYMDYLADRYRRNQEFARQRGWITSYRIFTNVYRREDEPHLFIMTEIPRLPSPQEEVERQRAFDQAMSETARQATEASGQRVRLRRFGSNILLQELRLRSPK